MSATVVEGAPRARPNGLYLASAACMLAGCYLVSGASSSAPHDVVRLLPIIGWLNLYEVLLIGVAGFLAARGLMRDARVLLTIEALFLADAAHLTAEAVTEAGPHWIVPAAGVLLLLGAKLLLIAALFRVGVAGLPLRRAIPAVLLLATLPGILSSVARTGMPLELPLYGVAWAIGLILMLEAIAPAPAPASLDTAEGAIHAFARSVRMAFAVSLPVHLFASHWLYDARFYPCSLAPWLLAAAVLVMRMPGSAAAPRLRAFLPAAALFVSMAWPDAFAIDAGIVLSPFRLALVVAGLVYLYDYTLHRQRFFLAGAAACGVAALSGHSLGAISDTVAALLNTGAGLRRFNTRHVWGGSAVAVAYLLLWLGARTSLRRAEASAAKVGR